MKKTQSPMTYESPKSEVMTIASEGIFCASTEEFGWNDGNSFDLDDDFSEWK